MSASRRASKEQRIVAELRLGNVEPGAVAKMQPLLPWFVARQQKLFGELLSDSLKRTRFKFINTFQGPKVKRAPLDSRMRRVQQELRSENPKVRWFEDIEREKLRRENLKELRTGKGRWAKDIKSAVA